MGKPGAGTRKLMCNSKNMNTGASKSIKKTSRLDERMVRVQEVVLKDTIPDVMRWVRMQMDVESQQPPSAEGLKGERRQEYVFNARAMARRITKKFNVRIMLNGSRYWNGEARLWENVCALCAKLPTSGNGNNIFDAMSRYPSSFLVYHGLRSSFGRYMILGGIKIPRFSLGQNAIALFNPNGSEETLAKKWFEIDTFTRMQETVIHMCGISEYVLRCAFFCMQENEQRRDRAIKFFSLLDTRIKKDHDYRNRELLRFEPWNALDEISTQYLSSCLEKSLNVAHDAVAEGAKVASRKYGRKEGNGRERGRIQLWMLRRPLTEIMDSLIKRLEAVVRELLSNQAEVDEFRLRAMRHLQSVESIYQDVGSIWFEEKDFRSPPELPKNTEALVSSSPYTFFRS